MALVLYDLTPSPNNIKVRLALGALQIPHERIRVMGDDRSKVLELTGQPRCPVLADDGKCVYDSGAILRYLDGNYAKGDVRLFSEDYARFGEIERWEQWTRNELQPSVGMVFTHFFSEERDDRLLADANERLADCASHVEQELADGDGWLVDGRLTAADLTVASFLYYGVITPEKAAAWSPISEHFAAHYRLADDGFDRIRDWLGRIMLFDAAG